MASGSGEVTLMLITEADKPPLSINFSRTTFVIIKVALVLLVVGFIVGLFTYTRLLEHSYERTKLLSENGELRRYGAKVDTLERNLEVYRSMLKKMTDLAGINLTEYGMSGADSVANFAAIGSLEKQSKSHVTKNPKAHPKPSGFPVQGYVSRSFRPMDDNPNTRHFGIDLAVHEGTPVHATADGVVTYAGWDSTFGWKVVMTHADGIETVFGHNDSLTVEVGDVKKFGEVIAISGNTGMSTAPHVHYEIRKDGNPVNPDEYIEKK